MAPNTKSAQVVQGDISQHKKDLELLKDQDPEFYEFLKHNDKALLEFGADYDDLDSDDLDANGDDDDEVADEMEADDDHPASEEDEENEPFEPMDEDMVDAEESEEETQAELLSLEMINGWTDAMKNKYSIAATKKFISALSSVSRANSEGTAAEQGKKYAIESDEVYGQLILGSVQIVPLVFDRIFNSKNGDDSLKKQFLLPIVSEKWPRNRNIIKSWLTNLMTSMAQLSDIVMLDYVLRQILANNVVLYFACFGSNSLGRKFVKMILDVWSSVSSLSGVDEKEASSAEHQKRMKQLRSLKLSAFVIIRQLAFHAPSTFMEICLKSAYKSFMSVSMNTNSATLAHLKFLQDCLVELFKLDPVQAYQNAFVEIRQIATRLRNAITQMNDDTSKQLYTWQVVHGLKFWCHCLPKLISNQETKGEYRQLIYPLTQVCFGLLRHAQGSQFHPLHYHIISGLNELSRGTETFIPVCSPLLQTLERLCALKKQKPASLKALDWSTNFRAPGTYLSTQIYTDDSIDKFLGLVVENLEIWSGHISFPELSFVCLMNLKKMYKDSKNPRFVNFSKTVVSKISENRQYIIDKRSTVTFTPNDAAAIREFMQSNSTDSTPLGVYLKTLQVAHRSGK